LSTQYRTRAVVLLPPGLALDLVQNPYADHTELIAVVRNVRDDPLAGMYSRRFIDSAQFHAGRTWQAHWEDSEVGTVRAIDPTKEPVDGKGPTPAPFTDKQKNAFVELHMAGRLLGYEGNLLVQDVLGRRLQIAHAAQLRSRPTKYVGQRFRECLETMAKLWSYA